MLKVYKKLSKEQIEKNVVFSSCLSVARTEQSDDLIHEVLEDDPEKWTKIERLKDDKFFNASHWKYNILRNQFLASVPVQNDRRRKLKVKFNQKVVKNNENNNK